MYKLIIFDMDGTLIRTPINYVKSLLEECLEDKKKLSNYWVKRIWQGPDRNEYLQKLEIKDIKSFWDNFKKLDSPKRREKVISVYPDITYLHNLKIRYKLKFAVLSDAHSDITKMQADFIGNNLFDIIINSNKYNGVKSKPNPEGALIILDKLNMKKEESILVGDSELDLMCAENTGLTGILIDRGEYYYKIQAKYKINELSELIGFLENADK